MTVDPIPFDRQLERILQESPIFSSIFDRSDQISLPQWYVAGGCVTQTVWNWTCELPAIHGLKDVDLVYFNPGESEADEQAQRLRVQELFSDLLLPIDVINEARVHEWYPRKFNRSIPPYTSVEDGIRSWLPAFSIGVRVEKFETEVFAPFGLSDCFNMVVRPNKRQITDSIYETMVLRLRRDWPGVVVIPWNQG